jgi:hypothetical protein
MKNSIRIAVACGMLVMTGCDISDVMRGGDDAVRVMMRLGLGAGVSEDSGFGGAAFQIGDDPGDFVVPDLERARPGRDYKDDTVRLASWTRGLEIRIRPEFHQESRSPSAAVRRVYAERRALAGSRR